MSIRRLLALFTLALTSLAVGGALTASTANAAGPNWTSTVTVTPEGSHVLGNPQAKLKLTEYVSYTCPHCAHFEIESDAPLRLGYVSTGQVSVEVKHLLRDPVDATVALLANCGPKEKFFGNHAAFMRRQDQWMAPLAVASDGQRQRWSTGSYLARRRAIAADFHLYDIMERLGYSRPMADHCLADEAMAKRIAGHNADADRLGIEGTPSFVLNGALLAGTHTWETVEAQLRAQR